MALSNTRHVAKTVEIGVRVSEVWKALTNAEELKRWFPLDAEVKPGPGGSIRMAWRDDFVWTFDVDVWEDEKHLRLVYDPAKDFTAYSEPAPAEATPGEAKLLSVDYHLEGKAGATVLRLVHSGFGVGADWDQEYDSVSRGWDSELISLRHYLEAHSGQPREVAWAKVELSEPVESAWEKITGPHALAAKGSFKNLKEGDRYEVETVTGQRFSGQVQLINSPKDFSGSIENMNNGVLRVWIDRVADRTVANLWLSTYGIAKSDVEDFENRWTKILQDLIN